MIWKDELKERLDSFRQEHRIDEDNLVVSIKIRVTNGCFHREHSPNAFELIDNLNYSKSDNKVIEHENGPEVIAYVALATASISFLQSTISLVTEILKARKEGVTKGDYPKDNLTVIIRGFDKKGSLKEENIIEVSSSKPIDKKVIEKTLNKALKAFRK
jgi:hypothetical protein